MSYRARTSKKYHEKKTYVNENFTEIYATILNELQFPRYKISFRDPMKNNELITAQATIRLDKTQDIKKRKKVPRGIKQNYINSTCIILLGNDKNRLFSIEIIKIILNRIDNTNEENEDNNDSIVFKQDDEKELFDDIPNSDDEKELLDDLPKFDEDIEKYYEKEALQESSESDDKIINNFDLSELKKSKETKKKSSKKSSKKLVYYP